eukprot:scaffold7016_cov123-Isochrysis_galbana.AAC.17
MDPGNGTNSRQTQAQTPRGVTVGTLTLKRGPPLRVRGDRGQPPAHGRASPPPHLSRGNPHRPTPRLGPPPYPHPGLM